jgi:hypothetical protein
MKKIFNLQILSLVCIILSIAFVTSCDDDEEGSVGEVTLQSFGPSPVMRGGEMRFIGINMDKVNSVMLPGNVEVTSFVSQTSDMLVIQIPEAAMPGAVTLRTAQGEIVTKTEFGISEPITIKTISPAKVRPDDILTIEGTYLNLVAEVLFTDNISVTEFVSQTQSTLKVKVPHGAQTGPIVLVDGEDVPNKIKSENDVQVTLPVVTGLAPEPVKAGKALTISGTDLDLTTLVVFTGGANVDSANFTSQSATQIVLNIPLNAQNGTIKLVPKSQVESESTAQLVLVAPVVSAITPNPVKPGGTITVTGTDLDLITGVTLGGNKAGKIKTGGTATSILVEVPLDATTGVVNFSTNAKQTVSSPSPVAMVVPAITSFAPMAVATKDAPSITITGTNLDLVTKITFEGGFQSAVNNATPTQIVIPVVPGSLTGKFKLLTTNGTEIVSADPLTITPDVPNLPSVPAQAFIGSLLTLTGTNLNVAADLIFPGNVKATQFGTKSATTLEVYVPATVAAGTGKIKFVTAKNEIYESGPIAFRFPGVEPIVNPALMINNFDETGHDLGWDNWGGNVELGSDAAVGISGKYLHGKNATTNSWTWIWGCNHDQLPKKSVTKADHLLKLDVKITKALPAGANFQMELGGTWIDLGNLGGSTPNGGWITITYDLSTFGGLPATIPGSGEWGMNMAGGTGIDITGLYIDNIRFQKK